MKTWTLKFTTRDLELINQTIDILAELKSNFGDTTSIIEMARNRDLIPNVKNYNFGVCTFIRDWADSSKLYDRYDYLVTEFANSKRYTHISYAYPIGDMSEFYNSTIEQIWSNPKRYDLINSFIKTLENIKKSLDNMNNSDLLEIKYDRVKASETI